MAAPEPYMDLALPILRDNQDVDNETKANLWDIFHGTKDEGELSYMLRVMKIPNQLKADLFRAKQQTIALGRPHIGENAERGFNALSRIKDIDPKALILAEKFPNTAKALIQAAATEPKAVGEGKEKTAGGSTESKAKPKETGGVSLPQRSGYYPPIPEGYHRILASDGSLHDLPAENLEKAYAIDPGLRVLNPQT